MEIDSYGGAFHYHYESIKVINYLTGIILVFFYLASTALEAIGMPVHFRSGPLGVNGDVSRFEVLAALDALPPRRLLHPHRQVVAARGHRGNLGKRTTSAAEGNAIDIDARLA